MHTSRRHLRNASLLAAVVGMYSPVASADPTPSGPWSVTLRVASRWHVDSSHDAFSSSEASPSVGVGAGLDVLHIGQKLTLTAEIAWDHEAVSRGLQQTFESARETHDLTAGASLRWALLPWLQPYVRVMGGVERWDVTLTPNDYVNVPLVDGGWSAVGSAGLGFALRSHGLLGPLGLEFSAESGVTMVTTANVLVSPQTPSDATAAADQLTTRPVRLGGVSDSAVYLRFGATVRF